VSALKREEVEAAKRLHSLLLRFSHPLPMHPIIDKNANRKFTQRR
jgi:hypothetical protein